MSHPRSPIDASPFTLVHAPDQGQVRWDELFGNDQPVELEIGSGKGLFLQNQATLHPDRNYLGIEISRKYARKAAERVAKHGLTNVRVWAGDARPFLAACVPPESLAAAHVYFPDPWWKARHKKRRVFTESLLRDLQAGLRDGGSLRVATDVEEYFQVIRDLIGAFPGFVPTPVEENLAPRNDLDYLTNFERKYRIEGRPIFRFDARLRRDLIPAADLARDVQRTRPPSRDADASS
ncbi:MAG: tRNA (guanosine(46)-N7)-methyltransferase TrmB [Isosphaeraceae bacterium]